MKTLILRSMGIYLNSLSLIAPGKAAQLGFNLFCYPFRPTINSKQRAFLKSADQGTFEHNGVKIQCYRWGTGPKNILMLHGWQSHTYRWKKYIESLNKEEYSLHAFDAPGHGLSGGKFLTVPLYSEVIENYISRIGPLDSTISHSIGSFSALYTFYKNPKLSSGRIVTLASPGEAQEFFDFYQRSLALSNRCIQYVTDRFEEVFQMKPSGFSAPYFASSIQVPGLIIHDEEDDNTPVIHSRRIHEAWKNSRFIATKGLGHNLRSDDVVNEVMKFIQEPNFYQSASNDAFFKK